MANEMIKLFAEANRLGLKDYRKLPQAELRALIESAKGTGSTPTKGKGKTSTNGTASKGKGKTAVTKAVKTTPAKGKAKTTSTAPKGKTPAKGKSSSSKTVKASPAKSTARKTTPTKGKVAQGAKVKRTPARGRKVATGRVPIDNSKVDWKAESNVGQSGKRKEVLDALRRYKGDKTKVFAKLQDKARTYYKGKTKHEAERDLVWLIGRVAYDFAYKTGQHEPGQRAAYGTSDAPQDVRRREQRAEAQKAAQKAARASRKSAPGKGRAPAKGKTKTSAARKVRAATAKGKGRR